MFNEDRRARGGAPAWILVVGTEPDAPSARPTPDSYTWFTTTHASLAPS
jgi:hypothetical protein